MSAEFAFAIYDRKLAAPFRYGDRTLSSRQGLILRRELKGQVFYAEASPLPGHSQENLDSVVAAMSMLSSPSHAGRLPAALRFALDSFTVALQPQHLHPVRSNALLAWQGKAAATKALSLAAQAGYQVFKVKLFPENQADLLEFLAENRSHKFRLDANRSLSRPQAESFLGELARRELTSCIDYLEEPFAEFTEANLNSPVPLAADESANSLECIFRLLDQPGSPRVYVLKPTVLGSLLELGEICGELRAAGKRAVVTTTFESEVGRRSLIQFLAAQHASETHGLSTGFLFQENFLPDQALYSDIPLATTGEAAWLASLEWRECR